MWMPSGPERNLRMVLESLKNRSIQPPWPMWPQGGYADLCRARWASDLKQWQLDGLAFVCRRQSHFDGMVLTRHSLQLGIVVGAAEAAGRSIWNARPGNE